MITLSQDIIIYVLIAITIILVLIILRLELRINRLMRGKHAQSLEDVFNQIKTEVTSLQGFQGDVERYMQSVEKRLRRSIQGVHNIHFKAFEGLESGGNQSFATAFLNENGDGIILSTLHARDRVNVYSKPVQNFECAITLSEEEQDALTKARQSCKL